MSDFDDYSDEMALNSRTDAAIEAVIADPSNDPLFGAFIDDARLVASATVPAVSPALALLLANGASRPAPVSASAEAIGGIASATATATTSSRRRKMPIPAFLIALPFAAKIALGVGVAAAATTGAGVAGVLPGPIQNVVATTVSAITPFEITDGTTSHTSVPPSDPNNFGVTVSNDAQDGGVDGADVSSNAKDNGANPDARSNVPSTLPAMGGNGVDRSSANNPVDPPVGPPASTPSGPPASTPGQSGQAQN